MTRAIISLLLFAPIICLYAIPLPNPFAPGDVVVVKPVNVAGSGSTSTQRHPAVVLDHPNAANEHKIALMSSNLPNPPHAGTADASSYHAGLKGRVSLHPLTASASHLELTNKVSTGVDATNLGKLKTDIYNNCGAVVRRSDGQLVRRGGASCAMRHPAKSAKHVVPKSGNHKALRKPVQASSAHKTTAKVHKISTKSKVAAAHKKPVRQQKSKAAPNHAARRPAAAQKKALKPKHK